MGEQDWRELIGGLTRAAEEFGAWQGAMVSELRERANRLSAQAGYFAGYLTGLSEMADHLAQVRRHLQASLADLEARQLAMEGQYGKLSAWERELSAKETAPGQSADQEAPVAGLGELRGALAEKSVQIGELKRLREALVKQHALLDELEGLRAMVAPQNAQLHELDILRGRAEALEKEMGGDPAGALPRMQAESASVVAAPADAGLKNTFQKVLKSKSGGPRRQLGEILILSGILNQEQIDEAVRIQVSDPQRRFGAIIVELGYATEDVIGTALAAQQHTRFVESLEREMTPEAMRLMPQKLAIHHRCVPLSVGDGTLVLAMVNPLDLIAIEDIERATDSSVLPVVATASAIDRVLAKYYSKTKSSGFTTR